MIMQSLKLKSVRHKLLLMVLVANLLTLMVAALTLLYHNFIEHQEKAVATLSTLAGTLGQASAASLEFDDIKVANENLIQLRENPGIVSAALYKPDKTLFASYIFDTSSPTIIPTSPQAEGFLFDKGELAVFKNIETPQGKMGIVYIKEHYNISAWLYDYLIILGMVLLVSLTLGLAISSRLQRWISGPIQAVSGVARQVMEQHNYKLRAVKSTEDEIGQLADDFNGMLEALEHEISERSAAEQAVRLLNIQLEKRVADRTAELELANQHLVLRTEEAETANRAKADFLANMSHEIRTPMNAILGLAYLLHQKNLDADSEDLVKKIRNAGRSLQSIINDILDFSKIEAGRLEIECAQFRLADVLDNLSGIMAANAGEKDLELVIGPSPDIGGQLLGDALRLEQILINLTSNAIKFTDKGVVSVNIQLHSRTNEIVTLRFAVSDTGIGIPIEKQTQIFTAFTQEDVSTTRRYGGTGLGLTICRHLVTKMGGKIGVNSNPGEGSEFWFTIPFSFQAYTELVPPEIAGLDVLIIDDSEIARETLSLTAQSIGWNPTKAESGVTALETLDTRTNLEHKNPFNLYLIDWKMPGMDGLQVARNIKANHQDNEAPIVLMITAFSREELLRQPDINHIDGILSKPVTSSSLYNTVVEILRQRVEKNLDGYKTLVERKRQRIPGLRVLVVDDSEINREVAMRILVSEGGAVQLANDGKEAVDWLQANPKAVDLVLMDVQMPVMDGYEATIQLRKIPGLEVLPIIALTAGAFKSQQEAAKNAGMNAFVAKPFNVDELLSAIQSLTERRDDNVQQPPIAKESSTSIADLDFQAIDLKKGLNIWNDIDAYKKFLRKFITEYKNSSGEFFNFYMANDFAMAKTLAHKIKGAAGNLALPEVATSSAKLEIADMDDWKALLSKYNESFKVAIESVELFTSEIDDPDTSNKTIIDVSSEIIISVLKTLLSALDKDTPDEAYEIIAALENALNKTEELASLKECLDNFDFRGAEEQVHILIARYQD